MHLVATVPKVCNKELITDLLKDETKDDILYRKNMSDDTCIELAYLFDNDEFNRQVIERFNLMESYFEHMTEMRFYAVLKNEINPLTLYSKYASVKEFLSNHDSV